MKQKDCDHAEIMFGSGDYYIFCHCCGMSWVVHGPGNERGRDKNGIPIGSEDAVYNEGIGIGLSGEIRVKPVLGVRDPNGS